MKIAPILFVFLNLVFIGTTAFGGDLAYLRSGWEYSTDHQNWVNVDMPCVTKNIDSSSKGYFRRQFTEAKNFKEPMLFVKAMSQPFEVMADGKTIYKYLDVKDSSPAFRGYPWHLIALPKSASTEAIEIVTRKNAQNFLGFCKDIYLGNRDDIYKSIVRDDIGFLIVSILVFSIGLASFGASIFSKRAKPLRSFAFLSLAIGTWIFSTPEVKSRLFLINDPYFWMFPDQISLFLVPIAFVLYCRSLFGRQVWLLSSAFMWTHVLFAFVAVSLIATGYLDFVNANVAFNLIVPFTTICMITNISTMAVRKDRHARIVVLGICLFMGFAVHDWLVGMWFLNWQSLWLHWGFLILVAFLGASTLTYIRQLFLAEEQAKIISERYQAVSEMAQMVVHDVKRPFNLLKATLRTILNADSGSEIKTIAQENASAILSTTHQIGKTIQDLADLDGVPKIDLESLELSDVFASILREYQVQIDKLAIKIIRRENHREKILGDRAKIHRVVANIVQNAIEAQPDGGFISIDTMELEGEKSRQIKIDIGSNSYVEPTLVEKIFDRYVTDGKKYGTGLGLAIAKKFVELHNGKIWCESDLKNGTRFSIILQM